MRNPPLPKCDMAGYNGRGMSVLDWIKHKTHTDRYGTDFVRRMPYQKFDPADPINSNAWPLAGACRCVDEPPMRGLNAAEVIQGENSMRLYQTFTVCPGELDARYMAAQF